MPRKSIHASEYCEPNSGPKLIARGRNTCPRSWDRSRSSRSRRWPAARRWASPALRCTDHRLVVALPVVRREARLRRPVEIDQRVIGLGHPLPVHAPEQLVGQGLDLVVGAAAVIEIAGIEQHAGHQQRIVHRRQTGGGAIAHAGAQVEEVVKNPSSPLVPLAAPPCGASSKS